MATTSNPMGKASPHQFEAAERILSAVRTSRDRILAVMPTGTGRSMVVQLVAEALLASGRSVTVIANLRLELDQIQNNILGTYGDSAKLYFLTVNQLTDSRQSTPADLSDHVVIGINSSFATAFSERNRLAEILSTAHAIIGFTTIPTAKEHRVYGDAVYVLSFHDAVHQGLLPPITFNSIESHALGPRSTLSEINGALSNVVSRLTEGRTVFVCTYQPTLLSVYTGLTAFRSGPVTIGRMSNEDPRSEIERAKEADWIVASPSVLVGFHLRNVRHVVLMNRFPNLESLLRGVQCIFVNDGGQVWDLGNNLTLWRQLTDGDAWPIDDTAADSIEQATAAEAASQRWVTPNADGAASHDLMKRDRLIHVLRGIIKSKSDARSLAIGLFGEWGSGKSTIINLLKNGISNSKNIVFIEFNAWENEQVTSMPAALADAITQQIYHQRNVFRRFWLLLKHRSLMNEWMLSATLIVLLALLTTMVPITKLDDKLAYSSLAFIGPKLRDSVAVALTVFFAVQLAWKSSITQGLRALLKQVGYTEQIGLARRLRDDLSKLFRANRTRLRDLLPKWVKDRLGIVARSSTYVVVIDDLDRCSRQNVWNVVEATRLVAEFNEVVLIFAVDYRLLFDAIAERLHDKVTGEGHRERLSREFLAKILQLSVQLPTPSTTAVAHYIAMGLFKDAQAAPIVAGENSTTSVAQEDVRSNQDVSLLEVIDEPIQAAEQAPEQIDEYIASTSAQMTIFQECASAFEVTNPRTLLRLYNSLTLIKGMHVEVADEEVEYRRHAFYVFLTELCASQGKALSTLEEMLPPSTGAAKATPWSKARDYADRHGIRATAQHRLNLEAEQRARTTSLPII
jgi:GTPase SAR1 family protein